jgi:hypothetical protein
MTKRRRSKRSSAVFFVARVFPPADGLGVQVLRLMAAGNDLRHVDEWIGAHMRIPKEELALLVGAGRWFMQLRLCAAILHESVNILRDMAKEGHLAALEAKLNQPGKRALVSLRRVMDGTDRDVKRLLERVRHKGTFHYDHGQFEKSLARLIRGADGEEESRIIWERAGLFGGGTYYQFAEALRTEATLGIAGVGVDVGIDKMMQITRVAETFRTFVEAAFIAYVNVRSMGSEFRGGLPSRV